MPTASPQTRRTPDWKHRAQQVRTQLARHGHLRRAGETTRRWADTQIRALRTGRVDTPTTAELADIGLTSHSLTTAESRLLAELDWWVSRHGSAEVPQAATSRVVAGAPYQLGRQINNARHRHAHGQLSTALTEQLQRRPGWTWRADTHRLRDLWDGKYRQLAEHIHRHGSLDALPTPTYQWLVRQRERFDQLEPEQRRRLQMLPAALRRRDTRVQEFVDGAHAWLGAHPGQDLTALRYASTIALPGHERPFPLGRRATYYRRRRAGLEGTHPLPDAEARLIEELPGWTWQLKETNQRGPAPARAVAAIEQRRQ